MNKNIMNELLNRAKESAETPDVQGLVADLESFLKAEEKRASGQDTQNEWIKAREKLWTTFEKVALSNGVDPSTIKEEIVESGALSATDEETLQLIENVEGKKKPSPLRRRKLKTKV